MLTKEDLSFIAPLGITPEQVEKQLEWFKVGFPQLRLAKAATITDGIIKFSSEEIEQFTDDALNYTGNFSKFVPASGAATRMFKKLMEFQSGAESGETVQEFITNLQSFAFHDQLHKTLSYKGYNLEELIKNRDYSPIISTLLEPHGMNYGNLPKGLILFHKYQEKVRTAFEEQIIEGVEYAKMKDNTLHIHFTVSPDHLDLFSETLNEITETIVNQYGIALTIEFSQQKKSTDTIAVTNENKPFRTEDGNLLFRPGGHGALLENLNGMSHDLIFIKNIDNVVPDKLKHHTTLYKRALMGYLISIQQKIFEYIADVKNTENTIYELSQILEFTLNRLFIIPPADLDIEDEEVLRRYLLEKLDRPIRVCGMVRNEGEPGGGPFWAVNRDGSISLQIVEASQVNQNDEAQKEIFNNSTHFNPVDLVCGISRYNGERFNLMDYTDPSTGFISTKSHNGNPIRVQELPGLWNGAMANWNTIFVEVPLETFNPVKTVMDLLREQHQG